MIGYVVADIIWRYLSLNRLNRFWKGRRPIRCLRLSPECERENIQYHGNENCNLRSYCLPRICQQGAKEMTSRFPCLLTIRRQERPAGGIIGGKPLCTRISTRFANGAQRPPVGDCHDLYKRGVDRLAPEILRPSSLFVNVNSPEDMGEKAFEKCAKTYCVFKEPYGDADSGSVNIQARF